MLPNEALLVEAVPRRCGLSWLMANVFAKSRRDPHHLNAAFWIFFQLKQLLLDWCCICFHLETCYCFWNFEVVSHSRRFSVELSGIVIQVHQELMVVSLSNMFLLNSMCLPWSKSKQSCKEFYSLFISCILLFKTWRLFLHCISSQIFTLIVSFLLVSARSDSGLPQAIPGHLILAG